MTPPATVRLVGAVCVLTPTLLVTLARNEPALALEPGGPSGPPAPPATARDARAEMDGFAVALDAAVRRVSRPSPTMLAGRGTARAYRLPGYGAFFVLAPRALPVPRPAEPSAARAVEEAIRHLEKGLQTASPALRQQMEKNLHALRATRAELRAAARSRRLETVIVTTPDADYAVSGHPELSITGGSIVAHAQDEQAMQRLEQLRRALETEMAGQMRALEEAERTSGEPERELARRMEAQILELQARMEAVRREVEEARMDAERQVEMRLATPALPEAPAAAVAPAVPGTPASPPDPAAAPAPPLLPPAPWQYWFSAEEPADGRSEEALVRDVKAAVTSLLERRGASLRQLAPEEYVTVAVDFVPRMSILGSRVQKTLVVKVKKQDLDERRVGRVTADELRRRIEYAEY